MNLARIFAEQLCPVCGFKLDFKPWAEAAAKEKEQVCPCCGIHFGYDDQNEKEREAVYLTWRERWIEDGRRWWSKIPAPVDFNPPWQLARLEHFANLPTKATDA
jgi:hypothetical protein